MVTIKKGCIQVIELHLFFAQMNRSRHTQKVQCHWHIQLCGEIWTVLSWPQLIERKTQVNSEDFIIYSFIVPGRDTVQFFIYKNFL